MAGYIQNFFCGGISLLMLCLCLALPVKAAGQPKNHNDPGWAKTGQNKTWAYHLGGKQGGGLSILLGKEPLQLDKSQIPAAIKACEAVSVWVFSQLIPEQGGRGAYSLEVHEPGKRALLKATSGPIDPVPKKPRRPYLSALEFRHEPSPRKRLDELAKGLCDIALIPLCRIDQAMRIPGVRIAAIRPIFKERPLVLALSKKVQCDCAPFDCLLDLSYVWTIKH
jgi:ABC-type transport system substrate-binding protein